MNVFIAIFLGVSLLLWLIAIYFIKPKYAEAYLGSAFGALLIGGFLTYCFFMFALTQAFGGGGGSKPKGSVRYELELTFSADGEEHVFSGVYELEVGISENIDSGRSFSGNHYGEAIPIRIPGHETLYALKLRWAAGGRQFLIADACGISPSDFESGGDGSRALVRAVLAFKGPCELEAPAGPLFARFEDPDDYRTIEIVTPFDLNGPSGYHGIRLTKVVVDNTDRPVTFGRIPELPWTVLNSRWRQDIDGRRTSSYKFQTPDGPRGVQLSTKLFQEDFPDEH